MYNIVKTEVNIAKNIDYYFITNKASSKYDLLYL